MLKEFRTFIARGNVIDLAVGIMVGGAFTKIVDSLVADLMMPMLSLVLGKVDFSSIFVSLKGGSYATVAEAKAAGVPTVNVGIFLNVVIQFLILAFCVFLVVKAVNRAMPKETTEK